MSGTGIDVAPNLSQCPVPVIPAAYTGGMPRYAPYRTHPLTFHTQSYRKGTNCVRGTHHALFVFELHTKYNMCVHTLQASSTTKYVLLQYPSYLAVCTVGPPCQRTALAVFKSRRPPQNENKRQKTEKKYAGVVRSVIQKKEVTAESPTRLPPRRLPFHKIRTRTSE